MIRNINPDFGMEAEFASVEDMQAAIEKLDELNPLADGESWMPEDGLQEGRDYEVVERMLMNPATGSVAPESEWRKDFEDAKAYAESHGEDLAAIWGGETFEDAGLVEVRRNADGEWEEADA